MGRATGLFEPGNSCLMEEKKRIISCTNNTKITVYAENAHDSLKVMAIIISLIVCKNRYIKHTRFMNYVVLV